MGQKADPGIPYTDCSKVRFVMGQKADPGIPCTDCSKVRLLWDRKQTLVFHTLTAVK